jgi:hypothetical protein
MAIGTDNLATSVEHFSPDVDSRAGLAVLLGLRTGRRRR